MSDYQDFLLENLLSSPAYAGFDRSEFEPQLKWEIDSGQWVMMAKDNILLGWMSYYLCTDDVLAGIKNSNGFFPYGLDGTANELFTKGNNLLFANCWIAPWAPISTYKKLAQSANGRELNINRLAAFMHSKSGARRYHERRPYIGGG